MGWQKRLRIQPQKTQRAKELRGESTFPERLLYDLQRTRYPKKQGLSVIRYSNDDILEDVDAVCEDIARNEKRGMA